MFVHGWILRIGMHGLILFALIVELLRILAVEASVNLLNHFVLLEEILPLLSHFFDCESDQELPNSCVLVQNEQ